MIDSKNRRIINRPFLLFTAFDCSISPLSLSNTDFSFGIIRYRRCSVVICRSFFNCRLFSFSRRPRCQIIFSICSFGSLFSVFCSICFTFLYGFLNGFPRFFFCRSFYNIRLSDNLFFLCSLCIRFRYFFNLSFFILDKYFAFQ